MAPMSIQQRSTMKRVRCRMLNCFIARGSSILPSTRRSFLVITLEASLG